MLREKHSSAESRNKERWKDGETGSVVIGQAAAQQELRVKRFLAVFRSPDLLLVYNLVGLIMTGIL